MEGLRRGEKRGGEERERGGMKGSSEMLAIREAKGKTRREVSHQPRGSTELAGLEAGKRDEKSSLCALRLENVIVISSKAMSIARLGQRLCWRKCRVEPEGRRTSGSDCKLHLQ